MDMGLGRPDLVGDGCGGVGSGGCDQLPPLCWSSTFMLANRIVRLAVLPDIGGFPGSGRAIVVKYQVNPEPLRHATFTFARLRTSIFQSGPVHDCNLEVK